MEASALARALADAGVRATLSYAGRVERPRAQPVPVRVGGFGGVAGLVAHLRVEGVTHLVDATHPFAAQMSAHAAAAAAKAGVAHVALVRPAWEPVTGDRWQRVPDMAGAVAALAGPPRRVMLAVGRLHLDDFAAQPQHRYLLRLVDPPQAPPPLPDHVVVVDRGPFDAEADAALMRAHAIDIVVSKNAGGSGAAAKLVAARQLGLPVLMVDRPPMPPCTTVTDVAGVMAWLGHSADLGV